MVSCWSHLSIYDFLLTTEGDTASASMQVLSLPSIKAFACIIDLISYKPTVLTEAFRNVSGFLGKKVPV